MAEENRRNMKRYGIIAACGVLALTVIAGAYWLGRSAGPGGDIGEETAKSAALNHAEVAENDLSSYEISREESGGALVYEVKFRADGVSYDYEISAATGSIVKFSREADNTAPAAPLPEASAPEDGQIGEERAWEIAFDHAGVTGDSAAGEPAKLDYEAGALVYELKFFSGGYEYDYEISAADGSVVKFEKEPDPRSSPGQTPAGASGSSAPASGGSSAPQGGQSGASGNDIGEARAKEIALAHAGVAADSTSNYKWKLDFDDGISVYELEFFSGGYEYDYEVSAADGSVVKFEKEALDGYAAAQSAQGILTGDAVSYISEARAKEIAYGHAGLTADSVTRCAVELDHHDSRHSGYGSHHGTGCCAYEINFKSGGYEHEYKIDAVTGEILEFEQELDD